MNDTNIYADGHYLAQHPMWHAERSPWKAQHVVDGLTAVGVKPQSMCDIGCGTGLALAEVRKRMPSIVSAVGFEPSPDAPLHDDAKQLIERRQVDATTVEERFDVAIMLDVFEHVPDYLGFLNAVRHLAGHFVFHIPLEINAMGVVSGHLGNSRKNLGHLHVYTRRTALDSLRSCGYTPIHDHYTKAGWDGDGKTPWSKINLIRRPVHRISPRLAERLTGGLSLLVVATTEQS